jgi:hypothetical protein
MTNDKTESEIKKETTCRKSSGPDSLTAAFYQIA